MPEDLRTLSDEELIAYCRARNEGRIAVPTLNTVEDALDEALRRLERARAQREEDKRLLAACAAKLLDAAGPSLSE